MREEVATITIIAETLLKVPTQIHKEVGQQAKNLLRRLKNQLKTGVSQKQIHLAENPQIQMATVGKRNLE